jgi:hypothetical protein
MTTATLPHLALRDRLPVDQLRVFIRRDPALKSLGQHFGPRIRLYSEADWQQIKSAFLAAKGTTVQREPACA